jgi:hypothetical protein
MPDAHCGFYSLFGRLILKDYYHNYLTIKTSNMKKIMIIAISILGLAACKKELRSENTPQTPALSNTNSEMKLEAKRVTRSISDVLQSDPDPNPTSVFGGSLFYGTMTHLGTVHGKTVTTSFSPVSDGIFTLTSDDICYAANGDELWTKGYYVMTFPTNGSTTATMTGGSTIVGGTGRFAGATGNFVYENMVYDLVTGHESHTGHGEITY